MKDAEALTLSQTINLHEEGLRRLRCMWFDPNVLFYRDNVPQKNEFCPTVFLAGPTSRDGIPDYMWRKDATYFLRQYGYNGIILVPEPRGYSFLAKDRVDDFTDATKIYQWEHLGIRRATCVIVWIPRNKEQLLGLTTNREWGQLVGRAEHDTELSKSLYIGWPNEAQKMGSMEFELKQAKVGVKNGGHFTSLEELCKEVASLFAVFDSSDIPF